MTETGIKDGGVNPEGSPIAEYIARCVGSSGALRLLAYEFWMLGLADINGAVGFLLRRWLLRIILSKPAPRIILSPRVRFRGVDRIELGQAARIDEGVAVDCFPDAHGIRIGDHCLLERNVSLSTGPLDGAFIELGHYVSVGVGVVMVAHSQICIGNNVMIGPLSYLTGGEHISDNLELSMREQGHRGKGIRIEDDVWIGAGSIILDGVTIGQGSIVGAGAVVTRDIAPYTIVAGVPARLLRSRTNEAESVKD